LKWDYYGIEFWHDPAADLSAPNVRNFPNGFAKTMREIARQGMKPGLWIDSGGSVLVNGTTASNNTGSAPVTIRDHTLGKTVTVNQSNFNANAATGLFIQSAGVITLNNISANDNLGDHSYGVDLHNYDITGSPGVNILSTSGNNQFNGNAWIGLNVNSSGNISLSKVLASDNGAGGPSSGAYLYTTGTSSIGITCSAFNHNAKYGLEVDMGTGTLTFKGVAANHNNAANPTWGDLNLNKAPVMSWTVCGY